MKTPESLFFHLDRSNAIKKSPEGSSEGILFSQENQLDLARRLKSVYDNRPVIKSFIGAMAGTKYEKGYTTEALEKDEKYVRDTQARIYEDNSSSGRANLDYIETSFQLSEIMQAMIVDRMNNNWFKDCETIMTSEYDDLSVGIDAVMKHKRGGYLGASFDFTVTNKDKKIYDKLNDEWGRNVSKGKVQTVKYFEDAGNGQRGRLLVPKFVIGASKQDVEELAQAYLADDQETLDNHPFKYLMLIQMEEQLQTALDYYETDGENTSFDFAKTQYNRIQGLLRSMKNEIHLDEKMKDVDLYEYTKRSIALDMMRRFRVMRDRRGNELTV